MGYVLLFISIGFGVVSQLTVKWRINTKYGAIDIPDEVIAKILWFCFNVFFDPILIISMVITFLGGVSWMATMTKLEISVAYPFTSLGYVLVLVLSSYLFGELLTINKVVGIIFICLGIFISSRV